MHNQKHPDVQNILKKAEETIKTWEQQGKTRQNLLDEFKEMLNQKNTCSKCGNDTTPSNSTWIKTGNWTTMADFITNNQQLQQEYITCHDCQTKIIKFIITKDHI